MNENIHNSNLQRCVTHVGRPVASRAAQTRWPPGDADPVLMVQTGEARDTKSGSERIRKVRKLLSAQTGEDYTTLRSIIQHAGEESWVLRLLLEEEEDWFDWAERGEKRGGGRREMGRGEERGGKRREQLTGMYGRKGKKIGSISSRYIYIYIYI